MSDGDTGSTHVELDTLRRRFKRERATRQEAETIAERAISQWYAADRVKSALLDTVAHELRTPLTAIKGFSDMALKRWDQLTEEQRLIFMNNVRENALALGELIDDILDFGRLDRGAVTFNLEPIELGGYLRALVERLSGSFEDHTLRVEVVCDGVVSADRIALDRIVTNLLDNARKYSPAGGDIVVTCDEDRSGEEALAVVTVDDQGAGIPPDEREQVFEPFFRREVDKGMAVRGTGLGLPMVRRLAEELEGAVTITDAPGGGARVLLTLPLVEG